MPEDVRVWRRADGTGPSAVKTAVEALSLPSGPATALVRRAPGAWHVGTLRSGTDMKSYCLRELSGDALAFWINRCRAGGRVNVDLTGDQSWMRMRHLQV